MTLTGLHVPLVTPFDADGRVDERALRGLAERVLDDGAAGLVALGTTGEPGALTAAEQDRVVAVCRAACEARGGDGGGAQARDDRGRGEARGGGARGGEAI